MASENNTVIDLIKNDLLTGAIISGNTANIKSVLDTGVRVTEAQLGLAIKLKSTKVIKLLISNTTNLYNHTLPLLSWAVSNHLMDVAHLLVKCNVNVNLPELGAGGNTPLILSISMGHHNFSRLLLKKGADPFMTNNLFIDSFIYALIYNFKDLKPVPNYSRIISFAIAIIIINCGLYKGFGNSFHQFKNVFNKIFNKMVKYLVNSSVTNTRDNHDDSKPDNIEDEGMATIRI